jgi:hypothetical protein
MSEAYRGSEPLPLAPMLNPAFAPALPTAAQISVVIKCQECGKAIRNATYVVRSDVVYCTTCEGIEE